MARPLRIEYEKACYHISSRGNEKRDIFLDERDNKKFLFYLGIVRERYKIIVYAYVLMNNHYHLLIETPKPNLCRVMRDINGHYTIYFNKRHKRAGHLFQGRYRSILVEKDNYFLELSRYIHLNPVRAGIVSKPEDYKYSSMGYYIIKKGFFPWLNINFILEQFLNNKKTKQCISYKQFVYDGIAKKIGSPLNSVYESSLLGSQRFIEKITDGFLRDKNISHQIPGYKRLKFGKSLDDIGKCVSDYYDIDRDILTKRKIKFNNAKKVFVYLARKYTDNSLKQIRNFFNDSITEVAISKVFSRIQEELNKNNDLKKEIKEIEKIIF